MTASAASGIVLLDKPLGLSSHSATQRIKRLLRASRAGHVGSLDPLATGMLPVCLGEATKIAGQIVEGAKVYEFDIALGARTATGDAEGEIVETLPLPALTPERVDAVMRSFIGPGQQIPPMYSAIKQGGQPLYRLARQGREVERAARPIVIHALEGRPAGPDRLICRVRCGKGLYVRVLAEDIARALGSCGHVVRLRRTAVEPFEEAAMLTLEALAAMLERGEALPLLPADAPLAHLPAVHLDAAQARRIGQGQPVAAPGAPAAGWVEPAADPVRLYGPGGVFLGLGRSDQQAQLHARRLFVPEPASIPASAAPAEQSGA
jgi:tRNA pseudouridine55 synthase